MAKANWFRPVAERDFIIGDRVKWDNRDLGTVVGILDADALIVQYDNPKLGRAMAPAWSTRLQIVISIADDITMPSPTFTWDDGPTNVDFV